MLSRRQRLLAFANHLKRPMQRFAPVFLGFNAVVLLGGWAFHALYRAEQLDYMRAVYVTYSLVFMEHLLPFPEHWLLRLAYIALPALGLVVLLDGLVQFGGNVLRRDPQSNEWNLAMIETLDDHVILCGLGKAGFRTLEVLVRLGESVCVLEKDPACPNLAWARQHGIPILVGNGREAGIFDKLGAAAAKSVILATDDDLANVEMALDARAVNPDIHVVLRLWDQELARKIRGSFDIPVAVSSTALAAPLFATASSLRGIVHAFEVGDTLLVVATLEIAEGSELDGMTVGELTSGFPNLWVLSCGAEEAFAPAPDSVLTAGSRVTIQTEPDILRTVRRKNAAR